MKSMRNNVMGSLIVVMALIIIGISGSYAYFVNSVKEENKENQGVNVYSGALVMNFRTVDDKYIKASAANLINDADILTKADYTSFSITLPEGNVNTATYNVYLTDIKMTSNFKSQYLKWALYSADTKVASGDFSGVTLSSSATDGKCDVSNITLLGNTDINKGTTTSYKLYIWLSYEPNVQQNSLLNGSISAKVGFRGVTK